MLWEITEAKDAAQELGREAFLETHAGPVLQGLIMREGDLVADNTRRFSPTTGQPLRKTMRFDAGDLATAPQDGEAEPLSFVMKLSTDRTPPVALHIGRLVDSQITLADPSVSEHHATLTLGADFSTAQLVDHHSTNGSYVNGSKLRPYLAVDVAPGDTLRFGRVRFRFLNAEAFAALLFDS